LPFSFVSATTYIVAVVGSITGVEVMPISGKIVLPTSPVGTAVAPLTRKLTFHKGVVVVPSASNA
jgi:hypothetical protein